MLRNIALPNDVKAFQLITLDFFIFICITVGVMDLKDVEDLLDWSLRDFFELSLCILFFIQIGDEFISDFLISDLWALS